MKRTLIRILGIAGGALTLLPYLWIIAQALYTLALPDNAVHFESKGYASGFLIIFALPTVIAVAGFVGSLLFRIRILSAILMLASGVLMFVFGAPTLILNNIWLARIAPAMLITAGILNFVYNPNNANSSTTPEPPV